MRDRYIDELQKRNTRNQGSEQEIKKSKKRNNKQREKDIQRRKGKDNNIEKKT